MRELIVPPPLRRGDTVAIVSPSGSVSRDVVVGAADALRREGYGVKLGRHCLDRCDDGVNTFGGTAGQRLADLHDAFADPSVDAVLCSRGGYGVGQLLSEINVDLIAGHPKWLVGYSDITALHGVMHRAGIASLHAPMARHLAEHGAGMLSVLGGRSCAYEVAGSRFNCIGRASGTLVGGNLSLLDSLLATEFDMVRPGTILFIEDVGSEVFRVERMLCHLLLTGVLPRFAGLVVGSFTRYREAAHGGAMYGMIRSMVAGFGYPVAFSFPVGHADGRNVPLVEGAEAELCVSAESSKLTVAW